jgi:uncharacterized protein (TIGR03435 family)
MRFPIVLSLLSCAAFAQDSKLQFEVASLKISNAGPPPQGGMRRSGGPGTPDPSQITYTNLPLNMILTTAFDVKNYQFVAPSWLADVRVDISAKVPDGTTKEQANIMMQNLIIERFRAQVHRETRDLPSYELVIARSGLKMKESDQSIPTPADPKQADGGPPRVASVKGPDGMPLLAPGRKGMVIIGLGAGHQRVTARLEGIADLRRMAEQRVNRPVVDKTGLTGLYDFVLDFAPPGLASAPGDSASSTPGSAVTETYPPFEAAIESLGLHLESKKMPVQVVVIDRMEKIPVEN